MPETTTTAQEEKIPVSAALTAESLADADHAVTRTATAFPAASFVAVAIAP